jgi:hypothetical protein
MSVQAHSSMLPSSVDICSSAQLFTVTARSSSRQPTFMGS